MCPHGRRKTHCKPCGGTIWCPHGRQKSRCKECGLSQASTDLVGDLLSVEIDMRKDDFDGYVEGFGKVRAKQIAII